MVDAVAVKGEAEDAVAVAQRKIVVDVTAKIKDNITNKFICNWKE